MVEGGTPSRRPLFSTLGAAGLRLPLPACVNFMAPAREVTPFWFCRTCLDRDQVAIRVVIASRQSLCTYKEESWRADSAQMALPTRRAAPYITKSGTRVCTFRGVTRLLMYCHVPLYA